MQLNCKLKPTKLRLRSLLNFFLAVLLCLQLVALTQHHHDLSSRQDNCPACNLASHFSGGTPTIVATLPMAALILAYWIAAHPVRVVYPVLRRHVRPPSQAPPLA
ncbi:hypothetical protein TPL01_04100 [Sulfuriferula plumbiphila]|uniref:Uncharacterized protein n=1 Tax=Sulfuriferula plumbiphila TaxID=171865 RepID=A0A512L484_9PROT|nr:hypothetical protein [Sulfuriferula plumbiphila]BBP05431.1 hypothetical protein SFPGR_28530 [Sulfuriferula plumbiphila]GEP29272.1 hypothetical protein TPL01_04100 [Sulfuriferula plumbiphila]